MGSRKKASDYNVTAEFVVNNIKNTSNGVNGVAQELQTLFKSDTDVWKTTLKIFIYLDVTIK